MDGLASSVGNVYFLPCGEWAVVTFSRYTVITLHLYQAENLFLFTLFGNQHAFFFLNTGLSSILET